MSGGRIGRGGRRGASTRGWGRRKSERCTDILAFSGGGVGGFASAGRTACVSDVLLCTLLELVCQSFAGLGTNVAGREERIGRRVLDGQFVYGLLEVGSESGLGAMGEESAWKGGGRGLKGGVWAWDRVGIEPVRVGGESLEFEDAIKKKARKGKR